MSCHLPRGRNPGGGEGRDPQSSCGTALGRGNDIRIIMTKNNSIQINYTCVRVDGEREGAQTPLAVRERRPHGFDL